MDSLYHFSRFFLDLTDQGYWIAKSDSGDRINLGLNKEKAFIALEKLNEWYKKYVLTI